MQRLLQLLDEPHVLQPPLGVEPQQVKALLPGDVKAAVQRLAGVSPAGQPLPAQPDDHPFIGLRRVDDGPVDHVVLHQQQVPGTEKVGDALHHIGDLAAQQQDQLVKLMVMVVQLLRPAVLQMEQAEVLVQIAPLAHFAAVQHPSTPFAAQFAYLTALFTILQSEFRTKP